MSSCRRRASERPPRWASLLLAIAAACVMTGRASAQTVWELTPYRIQLIVGLGPSGELNSRLLGDLRRGVIDRAEATVGVAWDVAAMDPSPRLRYRMTRSLDGLVVEDLPKECADFDKVMLLAVTSGPTGYNVDAREFDVRAQSFGPMVRVPTWQAAKLCDAASLAMLDAFCPLARVVTSEKQTVTLRLRAGGLPTRDPSLVFVRPGDLFQPLMRYTDREGTLRKVVPIPWTLFMVERYTAKEFSCAVHSGLRNPMSGRRRGRVEQLALAVRPTGDATRLVVRSQATPTRGLPDCEVYAQTPGSKKTTLLGHTDADGAIRIPAGDGPLRLLLLKRGGALLARLPMAPGWMPEMSVDLPDDDSRLVAEEYITAMQENLVDLVTRRQLLLARAAKHIKAGELDKASKLVDTLREQPTRTELLTELQRRQEKIEPGDARARKKIDDLFGQTRGLVEKYFAPEPIEAMARDLVRAQSAPKPAAK